MKAMRIFVPQPIPPIAAARLEALGEVTTYPHTDRRIPYDELLEAVADKDILYAMGEIPYDARVIAAARRLRYIAAMHGSATFVDKEAATKRGIPVSLLGRRSVKTTAEFTFALLVATAWRIPEADQFMRAGKWKQNQSMAFLGTRLFGKTLGIVGLGQIGTGLAVRARALGMDIIYSKRTPLSQVQEAGLGVEYRSLEDLFRESDFLALTPPLTKETKGMIGADLLALMKPSAILINTSRGLVIDEAALVEGRIRGAGLDVYETRDPPGGVPWSLGAIQVAAQRGPDPTHRNGCTRVTRRDGGPGGGQHRAVREWPPSEQRLQSRDLRRASRAQRRGRLTAGPVGRAALRG